MSTDRIPASDYRAVWRRVLKEWLRWPEDRIEKFIARWHRDLSAPPSSRDGFWFYRELPFHYLTPLLLSPSLLSRCNGPEHIEIQHEIERAVYQQNTYEHMRPDFDWDAARQRVQAVLVRYDASLPMQDDLTFYEREEQNMTLEERIRKVEHELRARLPQKLDDDII